MMLVQHSVKILLAVPISVLRGDRFILDIYEKVTLNITITRTGLSMCSIGTTLSNNLKLMTSVNVPNTLKLADLNVALELR